MRLPWVQSCSRQLKLIESLTATQQFDVQSDSLVMKPLSLYKLVKNILIERAPIFNQHRVKVKQLFATDLPLVNADAQQLWRVFGNLIDNAVKYNQSGFILTVEAKREGEMVRCTVADNGAGISPQQCARLFEPYTRGVGVKLGQGLGLGLHICRQIVSAHGGQIGVESEEGQGSSFWFSLNLEKQSTPPHRSWWPCPAAAGNSEGSSRHRLFAENPGSQRPAAPPATLRDGVAA